MITVYFSLIFLIMVSFVMVLLESARVYIIGTMAERYANMAAEMVFSAYVQPLAEQYDLLAVDAGENGEGLRRFEDYLKLNLETDAQSRRLFGMYGRVQAAEAEMTASLRDHEWASMKEQIIRCEQYALGEDMIQGVTAWIGQLRETGIDESVDAYSGELQTGGQAMDSAMDAMKQQDQGEEAPEQAETAPPVEKETVTDPRPGISRWLKSGLLNLVMGDQSVSSRAVDTSDCSWHTTSSGKASVLDDFEAYGAVTEVLEEQSITDKLSQGLQEQGSQMLVDLYILDKFNRLCGYEGQEDEAHVLAYETEYILYGHGTDRENLESAITGIFGLRTLLNLVYLYTSREKGAALEGILQGLSLLQGIPVVGQVVKLLLMACWAAAEAVVDCAALADEKKVPLMKKDDSWNLTLEQLLAIGEKGGKAASFVKNGEKGLDYGQYLLLLLLLTPSEAKLIRMTQLMECNVRLTEGYGDFCLSRCAAAAEFSGTVQIGEWFWGHPAEQNHRVRTVYQY